jgi:CRP-like cAMP-binding protein
VVDTFARVGFLRKLHIFYGLNDVELTAIAEQLEEHAYPADSMIFEQGSKAESFYLIYSGGVKIVRKQEGKERHLATLVTNDYFGEMALIERRRRSGTCTAVVDSLLFILSRQNFDKLLKQYEQLRSNFDLAVRSRRLAQTLQFRWLAPEEVIYFLARKHPVVLYKNLILPVIGLLVPSFLFYAWNAIAPVLVVLFAAIATLVADILWVIWLAIDWSNDYYIVTNRRVVWLERVIGVYDSRQESPLTTILAVAVETDILGRALDYGDVIIRTFVGRIVFNNVSHPEQAQRMIEEYWNRTKEQAMGMEKEAMKEAIRRKLGLKAAPAPKEVPLKKADFPRERGFLRILRLLGASRLRLRYEQGDTVIYRKHWFVLFRQAWVPILGTLGVTGLFLYRLFQLALVPEAFISLQGGLTVDAWAGVLFIAFFPFMAWLIYEIADWSNDIYQVTNEQIIDLDKKPFGTESRNAAQLESILAIEYERIGILGEIFNYGTVYITVGGTKLAFEDVIDPASVQSDVNRRREALAARKRESQAAQERERMAEWLVAYHQNAESFRREQEQKPKPE